MIRQQRTCVAALHRGFVIKLWAVLFVWLLSHAACAEVLVDTFNDGNYDVGPAWSVTKVGGDSYVDASVQAEHAIDGTSLKLMVDSQANWAHNIFLQTSSEHPKRSVTYSFSLYSRNARERGVSWRLEDASGDEVVGIYVHSFGDTDPVPFLAYFENGVEINKRSDRLALDGLYHFTVDFDPVARLATYTVKNPSGIVIYSYPNIPTLSSEISKCVISASAGQETFQEYYCDNVSYSAGGLNDGLVAHYPLDRHALDTSGNGNHGVVVGATPTTDHNENPDSAYFFDGGGQRIEIPRSQSLEPGNVSVCAWVQPVDMDNWQIVVSKRYATGSSPFNSYILDTTWSAQPLSWRFCASSAGIQGCAIGPAIQTGDWSFLAGTDDGVRRKLYVNGHLVADEPSDGPIQYSSMGLYIGSTPDFGEGFKGKIDDVRIYNRALSANEVWQLYSGSYQLEQVEVQTGDDYASQQTEASVTADGRLACQSMSPVAAKSGDYRTKTDDAVLPCRGLPLQITRFYNSIEDYDGPFSFGWCFNQTVQLMQMAATNGEETAIVRWANGVRKDFTLTNGLYEAPLGCFDNLTTNAGGFVLTMPSGMDLYFNFGGFLTNQTDRYGNAVTYEHDLQNRISQVESADGRTLNYFYDNTINRVSNVTDWASRSWSYSYSTNDDLVRVTYPDGSAITYTFDGDHHLTGIYDARSNLISTLTYAEDSGRSMSYSEGSAVDYTFEYSSLSNYTTKTDSLGREHGFTYNEYGNKINKVDPAGNEMLFTWTADQQINCKTDHRGYPQHFEYDDRGNVVMASNALGHVTRYTYETNYNQVTSITDPLGNVVTNVYDAYGNLLTSTDARGFTTQYEYDQYGQLTNAIDANGQAASMSYNEHGELLRVSDPLGNSMTYTYDICGNRLSMTDARSNTWTYGYDVMGRILASTNPLGQVTSYEYDANGNRAAVTDARTNTTRFAYDEYNRLIAVTNALGIEAGRMVYDLYGNVVATYDALGNVASNTYDILNRLVTATDPLGNPTSFAYDENGNRTAVTDAMNNVTSYGFDPLNRMSAMTNALDDVWQYDYDANHNLLAVTDANSHTSTNAYDARNMVTNSANPLGHAYRYEYDGNGNILERQDPNGATLYYAYDAASRLTNIAYPDGSALTFTHDANGNVLSMSNRSETVRYDYDVLNRVTNVLVVGLNKRIAYEYDATGNRSAMIDPDGGRTAYEYDALNRLVELRDPETNAWVFSYDAANRMTNMVMANGINATYQYDQGSRLTNLVYRKSDTSILQSFAYTYDAVGNPLRVKREDNLYELYEYDNTYQLTHVDYDSSDTTGPGPRWTDYQYDPVGNRTNLANEAFTETYIYDAANRLLSVSSPLTTETLQWDGNGNLTNRLVDGSQSEAYTWDFDNKMVEIRYADGPTNTFEYYPGGLRLSKTLAGNTAINGRFESPAVTKTNDTEAVPSGWAWFSSIARDAGITRRVKRSGGQAIYFTSRGSNSAYQGVSLPMPVVTGKTYRFEVHALNDAGVPLAGNIYGQLSIEWKNETGGEISRTWGPTWDSTLSTDIWASVAVTGVAPIGAVSASFVISAFEGNPAGSGTFFVDDAIIEVVGETPERTEQYVYDGQNLLQEYDGLGTLMAQYVYSLGIDSLLARSAGGSQNYYLRDMIGSVTGIANTNETLTASYHYDVFGSVRKSWGGEDNPYLFTSRRLDQDSGLYYYRARYTGSGFGRFTSLDPMAQNNGYSYVGNRPSVAVDPSGEIIVYQSAEVAERLAPAMAILRGTETGRELLMRLDADSIFDMENLILPNSPYERTMPTPITYIQIDESKYGANVAGLGPFSVVNMGTVMDWRSDDDMSSLLEMGTCDPDMIRAVVLGHELIHAMHKWEGDPSSTFGVPLDLGWLKYDQELLTAGVEHRSDSDYTESGPNNYHETVTENKIREELGLKLREWY